MNSIADVNDVMALVIGIKIKIKRLGKPKGDATLVIELVARTI